MGTYSGLYTCGALHITTDSQVGEQGRTHTMDRSFNSATESDALSDSFIYTLYEDSHGTVWVGTNIGGICAYQPHRTVMGLMRHSSVQPGKLSYPSVRAFLDVGDGIIWIGTDNGLDIYNSTTGKVIQSRKAKDFGLFDIDALNIWTAEQIGTTIFLGLSGGLAIHDRQSSRTRTLYAQPENPNGLTDGRVTATLPAQGGLKGKMWVATGNFTTRDNTPGVQGGLNLVDPVTLRVERWWNPLQDAPDNSNVKAEDYIVRALCYDHENIDGLWVGTMNGLYRFQPQSKSRVIAVYRSQKQQADALRSSNINCVFVDRKKRVWVGTPMGLHRFVQASQTFEHTGVEQGFPDEWIYGIQEDPQGFLWISTNAGLVCYDPETRSVRHFGAGTGIQGNEYNTGAYSTVRTGPMAGALMFGGVQGINIFFPEAVLESVRDITPIVCALSVNQTRYVFRRAVSDSVTPSNIILPHDNNFIKIEFSSLDFNTIKATHYQYRLDGLDKDWQTVTPSDIPIATYTNLPPGDYVFRIRALRLDGQWSNHQTTLAITILSPWWRTQWAVILYTVLSVGSIIGLYRFSVWRLQRERELRRHAVEIRTAEIQRQNIQLATQKIQLEDQNNELNRVLEESQRTNEALQQLNHEKNEIMAIVAHDLKNPLSGISLTAENLMLRADRNQDEKIKKLAERIGTATERMMNIVSRLLDVNQIESGTLILRPTLNNIGDIVSSVIRQYEEQAKRKHIQVFSAISDTTLKILTDREALLQILENLFSNALKFTPSGKNIYVRVDARFDVAYSAQIVAIAIQDEGPGITQYEQSQLFQKFRRLSAQPTGGESSTGLGLSIVKRFADLIGARILCESIVGMGTTFTVILPLNQDINPENSDSV